MTHLRNRATVFGLMLFSTAVFFTPTVGVATERIFWIEELPFSIRASDFDGVNTSTLLTGLSTPIDIEAHNGFLYWTEADGLDLRRSELDGSNPTTLAGNGTDSNIQGLNGIAVNDDYIFATDDNVDIIHRFNLDGSGRITLHSMLDNPQGAAATDDFLFWVEGTSTIMRSDVDGGNVMPILTSLSTPEDVDVQGGFLYWTEGDGLDLKRSELDGSNPITLAGIGTDPNIQGLDWIAVSGRHIYVTTANNDLIHRWDLDGSNRVSLHTGLTNPAGITVVIPEPSALVLVLMGVAVFLLPCRRHAGSRSSTRIQAQGSL